MMLFLKVYIVTCHYWFLILGKRLYDMKADYQGRYIDMTQNDWTIAKYLTVDLMTGYRCMTGQKQRNCTSTTDGCWKSVCLAMTLSCQCYWNSNKLLWISFRRREIPVIIFQTRTIDAVTITDNNENSIINDLEIDKRYLINLNQSIDVQCI